MWSQSSRGSKFCNGKRITARLNLASADVVNFYQYLLPHMDKDARRIEKGYCIVQQLASFFALHVVIYTRIRRYRLLDRIRIKTLCSHRIVDATEKMVKTEARRGLIATHQTANTAINSSWVLGRRDNQSQLWSSSQAFVQY